MRQRGYQPIGINDDGTEVWNEPGKLSQHDLDLIDKWNATIPRKGLVRVLGDMFWRKDTIEQILRQLHGDIHLVLGNHDRRKILEQFPRITIKHPHMVKYGKQKIWLSHYAHRTWPCQPHGAWHLYGHSHGNLPHWYWLPAMDVGIDAVLEHRPLSMATDIAPRMEAQAESRVPCDHVRAVQELLARIDEDPALQDKIPPVITRLLRGIPHLLDGDHHLKQNETTSEED